MEKGFETNLNSVYFKLDYLSMVFNNCSMGEVSRIFLCELIPFEKLAESYEKMYINSNAYATEFKISTHCVTFVFKYYEVRQWLESNKFDSFYYLPFSWLKVDISGQGLDYLRSKGYLIDDFIKQSNKVCFGEGKSWHFTRVDFAFDFIDYKPDFFYKCLFYLTENTTQDNRVSCGVKRSFYAASVRLGDQRTFYLGSNKSDKFLRVYDKRLQLNQQGQLLSCPYVIYDLDQGDPILPTSWFRMELQCRRQNVIEDLLYSSVTFADILKYIHDTFFFNDEKGREVDFWKDFLPWDDLNSIIQNANFVNDIDYYEKTVNYVEGICFNSLVRYIALFGFDGFKKRINDILLNLQLSEDPVSFRKLMSLKKGLNNLEVDYNLRFINNDKGYLQLV